MEGGGVARTAFWAVGHRSRGGWERVVLGSVGGGGRRDLCRAMGSGCFHPRGRGGRGERAERAAGFSLFLGGRVAWGEAATTQDVVVQRVFSSFSHIVENQRPRSLAQPFEPFVQWTTV